MIEKRSGGLRRFRSRLLVGTAAAAVAALTLSACGGGGEADGGGDGDPKTLVVGVSGDIANLDPQVSGVALDNEVTKNTYAQWTKYVLPEVTGDEIGVVDVSQVVGEAVDVELSDDELTATFTIADGFTFPSGNPVTSEDFRYTIDRTISESLGSIFIFNTAGITDLSQFTEISDSQFEITLPEPSPLLMPLFRDQSISVLDSVTLTEHATEDDPWAKDWLSQNSLGGGAYKLGSYERGSQIVLEKNPDYPGADDVYFEKVILQIIPAEDQRAQLLANGTLDIAQDLSADSALSLQDTEGVRITGVPARAQHVLGFVQTFEPFSDVRVRQAIAHAIDYAGINDSLGQGLAAQPKGLWPQESFWFDESVDNSPLTYDLDEAKSLLAEAGYADGFEFEIAVSTASSTSQALAVAVQSALAEIGVTVNVNQLAPAAFSEGLRNKTGQAFVENVNGYVDDPYYALFLFYTSDAVLNWWAMDDGDIDRINAALRTETDPEKRQALATEAQERLNDIVPHLTLSEPNYILATGSDIQGFVLEPDSLIRYQTLSRAGG